jgi:surface antigen
MFVSDRSIASLAATAAAAAFLFASTLITSESLRAEPATGASRTYLFSALPPASPGGRELPGLTAPIEPGDDTATLEAIEIALTQASDGATYVWRRGNGRLVGAVRPTSTFRDAERRICRHIEMQLRLGAFTRRTEGIACRGADGVWDLEG